MAYRMGRSSRWQLLLNQQDPQQLSRLLHYHDEIIRQRRRTLEQYQNNLDQLATLEIKIQEHMQGLQHKQKQIQQQHDRLQRKRQQREQTLKRISALLKNKDQELQRQQKQRQELERIIAAAARVGGGLAFEKGHTPFANNKGKLAWPVRGSIQNRFGSKRQGQLQWDGVWIGTPAGTAVKAVHSGRVLFADWLPGQGLMMIIDHGGQYMSLYGHNQVLLKEPGEWVNGGDTIARSGDTGGQSSAGLYFEIRYQGKPTNPAAWCKRG